MTKKVRKLKVFGFPKPCQKPSKTPAKSMSQQACDFSAILARKSLCRKSADIDFVLAGPIRNGSRTLFFKSLLACFLAPKNLPKTIPKRGPNPLKIDAKNDAFFNIDLLKFRPRFWRALGLQAGAKLAIFASKLQMGCHFLPS